MNLFTLNGSGPFMHDLDSYLNGLSGRVPHAGGRRRRAWF